MAVPVKKPSRATVTVPPIGRLMALYDVQDYMRQNNGESPDVWCKNVWQYVYDKIEKLTNQK